MSFLKAATAFSLLTSFTQALPENAVKRSDACTPEAGGSASTDDVPAIAKAIASCGDGGTIVIPDNSTYYLNSVLDFEGCTGCDFQVEGLLKFTDSTDFWEGKEAMISVHDIEGVTIRSASGSGVIDGSGQKAWDLFASDESYERPTMLDIQGGSNVAVTGLRLKDPPNVFVSVKGGTETANFDDLTLDAVSESENEPKNTDGFDIGESTQVTMTNLDITNDDDCIAFKPGCNGVSVDTITCTGSHGISVGSLGKSSDDIVQNIYVENANMIDSTKAAGIKTYPSGGDHGVSTVTNVTFTGFTVENCGYAMQIQSCYGEEETCDDNPGNSKLTGIVFSDFSGTTSDEYEETANLNCGADGTCDVSVSDYTVTSPSGDSIVLCGNTPSDLGVDCTDGASG